MRLAPLAAALSGFALLAAAPAFANINQIQTHQQHRIYKGVQNGALTAQETYRLTQQQAHIARYEATSRADGHGLTRYERARISQMQQKASHTIYRQKHDRQGR